MGIVLSGVERAFGSTRALAGVSLEAEPGRVHAVLGENGAGKSTLMKILAGALLPDAGSMQLSGKPYAPSSPQQARERGVAIVYQELSVCPHLTVAENVLLGMEPTRGPLIDLSRARQRVEAVLKPLSGGRAIAADALVGELPLAAQQLVEIARALALPDAKLLILDEPTSSLTGDDVERLFSALRRLAEQGLTILYISHFLDEVRRLADDFTVLRDGRTVAGGRVEDSDNDTWVAQMAGRTVEKRARRSERRPGDVVLSVHELSGAALPRGASFELRRGEILGIAGLVGSGRTELLRALFGLDPVRSGRITVGGTRGSAGPAQRLRQGVGMLSEDRKNEGLATALSVAENLTLSKLTPFRRRGLLSPAAQRSAAERWAKELGIVLSDVGQAVGELSGGNQQKVAIARLLHHDVDVLLLDEPTRGIDVNARAQVHGLIEELAARGKAVLLVSSALPELLELCDRVAVMHRGQLGPARPVAELSEESLLAEATGV